MTRSIIPKIMMLTGCASGIGLHMAQLLAKQGYRLLVTDIDLGTLQTHFDEAENLLIRQLDVRDAGAWDSLIQLAIETWGRLDVLMNIAGYLKPAYILDATPEQVDQQMDINAKGLIYGTLAAAKQMAQQGDGHILNIASLAGLSPVPGLGLYSASKFAVRSFSLTAAIELREKGVYVTVIYPDAVQTPMLDMELQHEEAALTFSAPRILGVEDVAKVILWALEKRPLEVAIPRYRGWITKLAGVLTGLSPVLRPLLTKQGQSKQRQERQRRKIE